MSWTDGFEDILDEQVPLSDRTWLGVGGPAEYVAEPTDPDQLAELVIRCRDADVPVRILGGGSNVLVRDEGVPGVVVVMSAPPFIETTIAGSDVTCGGGAKLAHVISTAVSAGLAGLETLVGIPGTIGGALHGNTGSHGGDIGQWTSHATVLTRNGEFLERSRPDLVFAHRQSSLNELAIIRARLTLEDEDPQVVAKRMQKEWIATKANQPLSHQNAICVFKDPRGMSAQMLIDQAGLKSEASGAAEISSRHANFIIAGPDATAADVLQLIDNVRNAVAERMGVELETQVEIW